MSIFILISYENYIRISSVLVHDDSMPLRYNDFERKIEFCFIKTLTEVIVSKVGCEILGNPGWGYLPIMLVEIMKVYWFWTLYGSYLKHWCLVGVYISSIILHRGIALHCTCIICVSFLYLLMCTLFSLVYVYCVYSFPLDSIL